MSESKPTLTFIWCTPEELHGYWGLVEQGLAKIKGHTSERWLKEDVYHALKSAQASLHIGMVGNDYRGFVIMQQLNDYDGKVLHIWCAYSVGEDLLDAGKDQFMEWAHNINARRITFTSPRKGWEKVGPAIGFEPVTIKYELEVV